MGFIIAAAVAAAVIAFCFLCYKKAPPTQAIVVTGFGLSRPKVVCGRGVFVLPILAGGILALFLSLPMAHCAARRPPEHAPVENRRENAGNWR